MTTASSILILMLLMALVIRFSSPVQTAQHVLVRLKQPCLQFVKAEEGLVRCSMDAQLDMSNIHLLIKWNGSQQDKIFLSTIYVPHRASPFLSPSMFSFLFWLTKVFLLHSPLFFLSFLFWKISFSCSFLNLFIQFWILKSGKHQLCLFVRECFRVLFDNYTPIIDQNLAVAPTSVKSREHAVAFPFIEIRGMYANGLTSRREKDRALSSLMIKAQL